MSRRSKWRFVADGDPDRSCLQLPAVRRDERGGIRRLSDLQTVRSRTETGAERHLESDQVGFTEETSRQASTNRRSLVYEPVITHLITQLMHVILYLPVM